jgi:hypothetical protein
MLSFLGPAIGLFPSDFPAKIVFEFSISHIRAACPTHFVRFDSVALILSAQKYKC